MFLQTKNKPSNAKPKTCVAILPAAGSSTRMRGCGDKLFTKIHNIPIIALTLKQLDANPRINEIIIPTKEENISGIKNICKEHSIKKVSAIIPGGKTRSESVLKGIQAANNKFELIAIHDAARPFVSQDIITKTIASADLYNAAAPAVAMKDTIKVAENGTVVKTIPRNTLFAIQTPQVFDTTIISVALKKAIEEKLPITDDCSAVELLGMRIFLTKGDYFNIKITTPEDLLFAEAIAAQTHFNK